MSTFRILCSIQNLTQPFFLFTLFFQSVFQSKVYIIMLLIVNHNCNQSLFGSMAMVIKVNYLRERELRLRTAIPARHTWISIYFCNIIYSKLWSDILLYRHLIVPYQVILKCNKTVWLGLNINFICQALLINICNVFN